MLNDLLDPEWGHDAVVNSVVEEENLGRCNENTRQWDQAMIQSPVDASR